MNSCSHHWIIDSPDGETAHAICKLCGAERDYQTGHTGKGYNLYQKKRHKLPVVVLPNTLPMEGGDTDGTDSDTSYQ